MTDKATLLELSKPQQLALIDAFDDELGGHALWADTNVSVAYALNRKRLVDDFFVLTSEGERARASLKARASQ